MHPIEINWLEFDKGGREYGYAPIQLNAETIKANKGKQIVYLLKRDVDPIRGFCFPRYARIDIKHYSKLILNEGDESIDLRDVLEAGIKIENTNP